MAIPKGKKPAVSSASTEPKHKLIADRLLKEIESGTWTPGAQIPSEEQLANESGASLGTVRRALRTLAEMGVVERHHGRGTFVSGERAQERHLRHFRFVGEGSTKLLPVFFRILDVEETDESGPLADRAQDRSQQLHPHLAHRVGEQRVRYLQRGLLAERAVRLDPANVRRPRRRVDPRPAGRALQCTDLENQDSSCGAVRRSRRASHVSLASIPVNSE